ncbi:hypothetical protein B7P43_G04087 [Cryptotermes secundus]|uniref:DDE Tnp4 domain-containing protein n=1 Tax=Cryptotermes secundus TaxID=105785 RepID=A0A2J7QS38_9NEOP|nr:hypothetical protein B7P43_G04087 [Cryptotermes secundus]
MKRNVYSHVNLLGELKLVPKDWHNYLRMNEETYLQLLSLVAPLIKKKDTVMRMAISPHVRLTATLRYLATGRTYEDLKFTTVISPQALSTIIPETCDAIYKALHKEYYYRMSVSSFDELLVLVGPSVARENTNWRRSVPEVERLSVALRYLSMGMTMHGISHEYCLGVRTAQVIIESTCTCSVLWDVLVPLCMRPFSFLLMAWVDSNYRFLFVDIGGCGTSVDSTIFNYSTMNTLGIPQARLLPNDDNGQPVPFVLVADEAFGLPSESSNTPLQT